MVNQLGRTDSTPRPFSVSVGTTPLLISGAHTRYEFVLVNTHATQNLIIGVGYPPSYSAAGGIGGIFLYPSGTYSPDFPPDVDIWVIGSGAGTTVAGYER